VGKTEQVPNLMGPLFGNPVDIIIVIARKAIIFVSETGR
jgi:hypothetical protein